MKIISLLLIIFSLTFISCQDTPKCSLTLVNHKFYDLCRLDIAKVKGKNGDFSMSFGIPRLSSCDKSEKVWAIRKTKEECLDFPKIETAPLLNTHPIIDGIQIIAFSEPNEEEKPIQLNVSILCDRDKPSQGGSLALQIVKIEEKDDVTRIDMMASSLYGCAVTSSNKVFDFIIENKIFFTPILVILGIIYCFRGLRHFNTIIYLTLFGATLSFCGLILEEATSFSRSQLIFLVVLGFLFIADISLTYCFKKTQTMGYIIVGTAFGAVNGVLVYDTMLSPILRGYAGNTIFYIVVSICSLTAAGVAAWIQKDGFIIFTAFIGSFLIVRPISTILGGFPSEIAVSSGLESFDTTTYWYLVAVLVIASLGIRYQKKYYRYILRESKMKDEMITFSEYMQLF